MASLSLKHIYKVYENDGEGVKAVNDFNMEIADKEFIVFVGPSGCGKSTTLRMIAGLEEITAGELMIGDEVVNDVEPKDRNIAMVFQNYALYPHMTVRENMAFALKLRNKMSKEEINQRVEEAAKILDIEQFLDRKPRALSGGQRQRVSLGRAIVRDPKVFLLDEPLSNLDAKLRSQMRTEITKLHNRLNTTFIYVTHDQVEAMTMGTRIVVMKLGVVQQIDTPHNLYRYPQNKFVAGFIGTPQMNFFNATLKKVANNKVEITFANNHKILIPQECVLKADEKYFDGQTEVTFGIRPEDVHFDKEFVEANKDSSITCKINIIEALGSETIVYCELDESSNKVVTDSSTRLTLKVDPKVTVEKEQEITVAFDPQCIHLFDNQTEMTIVPRIPQYNAVSSKISGAKLNLLGKSVALPPSLQLPDGEYTVTIPTDAFWLQGVTTNKPTIAEEQNVYSIVPVGEKYQKKALKNVVKNCTTEQFDDYNVPFNSVLDAQVAFVEKFDKVQLLCVQSGKQRLFVQANTPIPDDLDKVQLAIDWKKVSFTDAQGTHYAFDFANSLPAKVSNELVGKKEYNFAFQIEDVNMYITDYIATKLFNAVGKKIFITNLTVDFSVYDVVIAPEGISGIVSEIYDFGAEHIAVVKVGESEINVYLRDDTVNKGDSVKLALNLPRLGIVETKRGIRIL